MKGSVYLATAAATAAFASPSGLTSFVTLNVPSPQQIDAALTLRFDIDPADGPCGTRRIEVNGELLTHDANGNGHGTLASHDGSPFAADWSLGCIMANEVPINTLMTMQVGLTGAAYNFSMTIQRDGMVELVAADGAAVMNRFENADAGRQASVAQIHELDSLRLSDRRLLDQLMAKEAEVAESLGSAPLVVYDEAPFVETWELGSQGEWVMVYGGDDFVSEPAKYHDRVTPLAVLIIVFSMIGLVALVKLHKRRRSERKRCSFHDRMSSWKERRARRKARKQAVKAYMRNLWAQLTERGAEPGEKQVVETSMDDEITQFKQAVDVVDSMVAAEEGRSSQADGFVDLDEGLPPYEECQETDELLPTVADGFREK